MYGVYDRYIKASVCHRRGKLGNDLRSKTHRKIMMLLDKHKTLWKLYRQESPFVKSKASIGNLKKFAKENAMFPKVLLTQFKNKVTDVPARSNANIGCGNKGLYRALCFAHAEATPTRISKIGTASYKAARRELDNMPPAEMIMSFRSRAEVGDYIHTHIFPELIRVCKDAFPHMDALKLPRIYVRPFKKGQTQAFYMSPSISCEHPRGDPKEHGYVVVHIRDLRHVDIADLTVVLAHEVFPGHFYQFEIARPEPFVGRSWFLEGWALYIERFADALGDAYKIARLKLRCLRAARCIMDPYIHNGGHSLDACIQKYSQLVPWVAEPDRFNDIMRYASMPGQACSYLIGCRRFERWSSKFRGTLKEFHARVLKCPPGPARYVENHLLHGKTSYKQSTRRKSQTQTPKQS